MPKVSPDEFLSRIGLRYGGNPDDLQGTPAQIVRNLTVLTEANDAGEWRTTDFITAPLSSASFDQANVAKRRALNVVYHDAVESGDPKAVHKAVDKYNKLLMVMSGQELVPPSDFEILCHA